MTLLYDNNRKRIICRWKERVKVTMDKREGRMDRVRSISVKVNDSGRLNNRDRARHEKHPMYRHIEEFNDELNRMEYYRPGVGSYRCTICGSDRDVTPHFDIKTQSVVWLCAAHRTLSPKVDA